MTFPVILLLMLLFTDTTSHIVHVVLCLFVYCFSAVFVVVYMLCLFVVVVPTFVDCVVSDVADTVRIVY